MIPLNVDWQQILLHLLNFVILAGGLYILLYSPVKKFMQKRIDFYKKMDDAANDKMKEADEKLASYEKQIADINAEGAKLRAESDARAKQAYDAKILAADEEGKRIIEKAKQNAEYEKNKILAQASDEIEDMVSKTVDKMLASKTGDPYDDFLESVQEGNK